MAGCPNWVGADQERHSWDPISSTPTFGPPIGPDAAQPPFFQAPRQSNPARRNGAAPWWTVSRSQECLRSGLVYVEKQDTSSGTHIVNETYCTLTYVQAKHRVLPNAAWSFSFYAERERISLKWTVRGFGKEAKESNLGRKKQERKVATLGTHFVAGAQAFPEHIRRTYPILPRTCAHKIIAPTQQERASQAQALAWR